MQHAEDLSLLRSLLSRIHTRGKSIVTWRRATAAALMLGTVAFVSTAVAQESGDNTASVNPMIGTGTGPGDNNNLFPGPTMPFGMVQLSPDTESHNYGYHYYQKDIQDFSMTHMSGVGCPNAGEVAFMPTTGPVEPEVSQYQSSYSHQQESASPGYYQVQLLRWGINAALTATDRTGVVQITFPAGKEANFLALTSHTLNNSTDSSIQIAGNDAIEGYVTNQTFCGSNHPVKVYYVMHFSRPFTTYGTYAGYRDGGPASVSNGARSETQGGVDKRIGGYVSWPASDNTWTVTVKIGISYVDQQGAENNLKTEAGDKTFQQVRDEAKAAWTKALGVIDVKGGTPDQQIVFYSALYHSLMMPNIFNDADGRYLGFDDQIHTMAAGHNLYDNFSGWDVYRSQMPLVALVDPARMADIAQSIVLMYQQGGWIDRWPQANQYTNVMAGSPLSIVLATAWLDGIHDFDMKAGWKGMYEDATQAPPKGKAYQGQLGIEWINKLHYVPNNHVEYGSGNNVTYGSVSQIQEDALAYASLYNLAKDLGKTDEARTLYERALYYRNVFNPKSRLFQPKDMDGLWVTPFDPTKDDGFIEGSAWHYQWLEPADLAWVIRAMGRDSFNQRLEHFFDYPVPMWNGEYYNPYNETDLEAPFEFNFSGEPWMTQHVVRRVLRENYPNDPNGIPGNDDAGEMSSWAVMSMMGIYSIDPASRAYELASPVFSDVTLHLQAPYSGKTFTIHTSPDPENNDYIQSVELNGKAHTKNWIRFQDISNGGSLNFTLGAAPNKSWGAAPADAPPSLSNEQP